MTINDDVELEYNPIRRCWHRRCCKVIFFGIVFLIIFIIVLSIALKYSRSKSKESTTTITTAITTSTTTTTAQPGELKIASRNNSSK